MGDRCWARALFHPDDYNNLIAEVPRTDYISYEPLPPVPGGGPTKENGWCEEWVLDKEHGRIEHVMCDLNYAGYDDFSLLAEARVRFLVWHGPGGNYGPGSYVSCGDGVFHSVATDHDGENPIVELNDNGLTNKAQLARGRKFLKARAKLSAQFDEKAKEYANET